MNRAEPHAEPRCSLCGCAGPFSPFFPGASLRETRCPSCRSSRRTRDLVRALLVSCFGPAAFHEVLEQKLAGLRGMRVYELQAQGPLHERLATLPEYRCSEYYPQLPSGARHPSGVLCQNAEALSFADGSFDLVISQDVLEHMNDPFAGLAEICRVLRPGGEHLFTVPLHEGMTTRRRARDTPQGVEHILPPVRHKDPLNTEGALVYWDFGGDFTRLLAERWLQASVAVNERLYKPDELCRIDSEAEYEAYLAARENPVAFFLYNSVVFSIRRP